MVVAVPAIDVNAADGGRHALGLHDLHHLGDLLGCQPGELAVVDGDVGLAPGRVLRQCRARHLAQQALCHRLHALEVTGPSSGILLVYF